MSENRKEKFFLRRRCGGNGVLTDRTLNRFLKNGGSRYVKYTPRKTSGAPMNDIIALQARLDGAALKTLSTDLTRACSEKSVRIDACDVTHLGALGVQLMLSASRTLRRDGGTFEFVAISDRASDQLAKMGLSPEAIAEGTI